MKLIKGEKPHITALASYRIYPAKMGGQKGIASFYQAFSKELPVTLISTANNSNSEQFSGEFLPLMRKTQLRYADLFFLFRLRKIMKERNSSWLIIEHPYLGWMAVLMKWIWGVRFIVHSHNIEALRFKTLRKWWWKLLWQYEKKVHQQADLNFFITDEDRQLAIDEFRLQPSNCFTITYGFELAAPPSEYEKKAARKQICTNHQISETDLLLLFNGTLDYKPNLDALNAILLQINPFVYDQLKDSYKIIICGKNLPETFDQLYAYNEKNIIYAGFVDDINAYFKGSDIFLNPVTDGGGIKTKLVEALGFSMHCITSTSGAIGVPQAITGDKMMIIKDHDWDGFINAIISFKKNNEPIIPKFFDHFYWNNIAKKAADNIIKQNTL